MIKVQQLNIVKDIKQPQSFNIPIGYKPGLGFEEEICHAKLWKGYPGVKTLSSKLAHATINLSYPFIPNPDLKISRYFTISPIVAAVSTV